MDIHPRPTHAQVEVRVDGKTIPLGSLDESSLIQSINAARLVLAMAVWDRHFVYEEIRYFDFLYHFGSVDACESFLAEEWEDVELDPATAARARELLSGRAGELVIREQVWASCLRRT